jgi:muramidase (phage lysozyme)
MYGGNEAPFTDMTIEEVLDFQKQMINSGMESSAVGKYQFINKTLKDIVEKNPKDFPLDAKFNETMQDRAAGLLLHRRGASDFVDGKIDTEKFGLNLAKEWASLPVLSDVKGKKRGQSYYAGDGLNTARYKPEEVEAMLQQVLTTEEDQISKALQETGVAETKPRMLNGV